MYNTFKRILRSNFEIAIFHSNENPEKTKETKGDIETKNELSIFRIRQLFISGMPRVATCPELFKAIWKFELHQKSFYYNQIRINIHYFEKITNKNINKFKRKQSMSIVPSTVDKDKKPKKESQDEKKTAAETIAETVQMGPTGVRTRKQRLEEQKKKLAEEAEKEKAQMKINAATIANGNQVISPNGGNDNVLGI